MGNLESTVLNMRKFFENNVTKSVAFRRAALQKLKTALLQNEQKIYDALKADLNKSVYEAYTTEVGMVLSEISFALKNLKKWAKPQKAKTPLVHLISKSYIYHEPHGIVLIMSPWNYPFMLTLAPLVGAIAAGNCVVVKPSRQTTATTKIISDIISGIYFPNHVKVLVNEEYDEVLHQKYDYIFFTGSTNVGRTVMKVAAENLTPVTLELGGKSPCIVDKSANVDLSAKRIIWGKFLNAGQTCVAPDYLYVHKSIKKEFIESAKKYIQKFFGATPENNPDFPKIINEKHFLRLSALLKNGTVAIGGGVNAAENKIAPTLLTDIDWSSPIMNDEVFGPILPILEFDEIRETIAAIKAQPKPLALYLFLTDKKTEKKLLTELSFGGGCVNDVVVHLATPYLPFGGVGDSGLGSYHGKNSFMTFSHPKSILKKSNILDLNIRYAPYDKSLKLVKMFLK